jgi:hypothetical protein
MSALEVARNGNATRASGIEAHGDLAKSEFAPEVHGIDSHVAGDGARDSEDADVVMTIDEIKASKTGKFAYFKTRQFYIVLVLG